MSDTYAQLSESDALAVIDAATDFAYMSDPDGRVRWVSAAGERLLGYAHGELIGTDGWRVLHPDDVAMITAWIAGLDREESATDVVEVRLRRHDGAYRTIALGARLRRNPDGTVAGFLGGGRDITDLDLRESVLAMALEQLPTAGVMVLNPDMEIIEALVGRAGRPGDDPRSEG